MQHKQCSRHAVHKALKSKTCLFTYNAKSNLLSMQVISLTRTEVRYQNRLIRLAVSYRSRFSNTLKMHSTPGNEHINGLLKFQINVYYHHTEIELNPEQSDECGHSFSSVRFYVLFNSLFRVLFNGAVGVPPPESKKPYRRVLQAQPRLYLIRTDAPKRGLPFAADSWSRTCVKSRARASPNLWPEGRAVRADSLRPVTSLS